MGNSRKSAVYLSGWEYNRLLQPDPTTPKVSALPASILWVGSHQLWMFEKIYVSTESLENELAATDRLGWIMGEVLRDMYDNGDGAIEPIDWTDLPPLLTDALKRAHVQTLRAIPETLIRSAIKEFDYTTLEIAKAELIRPILDAKGCVESGMPNSLTTWGKASHIRTSDLHLELKRLAELVARGASVCRRPDTTAAELNVQQTVEKPIITSLLAGESEYSGPRGYEAYFRSLEPHKAAYEDNNEKLRKDWRSNRDNLFRLREAASKYLWTDLHEYWIPRLTSVEDSSFSREFEAWIKRALMVPRIAKYLNSRQARIVIGTLSRSGANAVFEAAGIPSASVAIDVGVELTKQSSISRKAVRTANLALFYQETQNRK